MSPGPSRWMMPAIPHMLLTLSLPVSPGPGPVLALRQDVQVLRDVPVGDRGAEAFPLVRLVVVEDPVHVARHGVLDHGVLIERRDGLAQRHRNPLDVLAS